MDSLVTAAVPPKTFDALRQQIRDRFSDLSPHLQRIARSSLEEPNSFALSTTQVIAASLSVQPSTLIRFAKEFGFAGFSDLQRIFRQRLIEGEATVRDQVLARAEAEPVHDLKGVLEDSVRANTDSVARLGASCDIDKLTEATQMLRSARHVYVASLRRSRPIGDYLVYGLLRGERASSSLDFAGGMGGPQIATLGHEDVLVAIAFPPYSKPVLDAVMDAHVSGKRIVAITDGPESPLARNSQVALFVPSDVASRLQPIAGAVALVHAILTAIIQD